MNITNLEVDWRRSILGRRISLGVIISSMFQKYLFLLMKYIALYEKYLVN